jgi:hypothetical protein
MAFDSVAATQALIDAFATHAWARLRTMYRDDALLVSVAGGSEALGPDETISAIASAAHDVVYSIGFGMPERIDEHAAVVRGTVRGRLPDGRGSTLRQRVWIVTYLDGRLYRMRVYQNREEAQRDYRDHGVGLGL